MEDPHAVRSEDIQSIKGESFSDQVYNKMKHLIDMRIWPPGFRIPSENKLAEQFGVSRMTIRSATQKLRTIGVLDVRPGSGSYVKAISLEKYISDSAYSEMRPNLATEAYELRFYLEQAAVELAIKHSTPAKISVLRQILLDLNDSAVNHPEDYRDFDIKFHRYIYVMTDNNLLLAIFDLLAPLLRLQFDKYDRYSTSQQELLEGRLKLHTLLFQGIERKDVEFCQKHLLWYRATNEDWDSNPIEPPETNKPLRPSKKRGK